MQAVGQPTPALFLSYAREDATAARRIAEALRAQGLELWFDENKLRGGDSWDAKIRGQIREGTLCLAIISARAQARHEGYFRREWKSQLEPTRQADRAGTRYRLPPRGQCAPRRQQRACERFEALLADPKNNAPLF